MEKRVILAFALSIAVMYAFNALYRTTSRVAAPEQPTATPVPAAGNPPSATPEPIKVEKPNERREVPQALGDNVRAERAEDFAIDTPFYTARISNVGGVLKSYKLKQYSDAQGHPLELINETAGEKVGWPMVASTGDKALDDELQKAQFQGRLEDGKLTLDFAAGGLQARKIFQADRENYEFTIQSSIVKDGKDVMHSLAWQGGFGDQSIPQDPSKKNAVYQVDTTFKRIALRGIKEQQQLTSFRAGVEDQYFLGMFLSPDPPMTVHVAKQEYPGSDGKPVPVLVVSATVPSNAGFRVYAGPKQKDWLSKADPQLTNTLDYGYFGFIARPLVYCLLWIHSYIGNFGWSIILLTIVVNLVLFPLRLKQQVSMLKMQKIQPKMRRLQDQYKKLKATDPRRAQVQSEMMNLYKEHGVNPMGGCLPLLLQMPLLFGFYSALAYSIELRRAPWIFWIKDLSQYDPYYVIPILMAVAMIVQQKLTPTANVDPAQAKMMMLMPLMMTFMFLFYSSGLALYWLTGSIIGVVQQVYINKYWSPQAEAKVSARPDEPRGA
jgi:YidC/Oxa1 family membrane protein insertase